jgi:hypothetical protein
MDYLMLILVFGAIGVVFIWGLKRDLWKVDGCSGCSAPMHFDRQQALKEAEEARQKKLELKRLKKLAKDRAFH